ncbi:hypothetical protein Y1Q_0002311 [Alligator mississippiensis]|uniref:Uncharacterized protein n=1 Tax=Alligator mississippiensis TaxID=8496 RepID=A0A151MGN6_ALLMI|nr:hypothetical protein Y1Q_0002311 [Alligator mississippiensis]
MNTISPYFQPNPGSQPPPPAPPTLGWADCATRAAVEDFKSLKQDDFMNVSKVKMAKTILIAASVIIMCGHMIIT